MTTTIAPTARPSRERAHDAVASSGHHAPAHLRKALLAEASRRSEQLEQSAPTLDEDLGQALRAAAQHTMAEVVQALNRWAEGSYGLCLTCRDEIPIARLELRPWAPSCVECAER